MKKALGTLAAIVLTFVAANAGAATATQPTCESIVFITGTSAYECYCNFGTNCTPPAGVPHCTAAQCSVVVSG
jgi:hypothetical protein